jgi:hypothetical protein
MNSNQSEHSEAHGNFGAFAVSVAFGASTTSGSPWTNTRGANAKRNQRGQIWEPTHKEPKAEESRDTWEEGWGGRWDMHGNQLLRASVDPIRQALIEDASAARRLQVDYSSLQVNY